MGLRIVSLFVLAILLITLATPITYSLTIPSKVEKVRVLVYINPRLFRDYFVSSLNARIIYKVSIAPVIILEMPSNLVDALAQVEGVVSFSLDQEVRVFSDTIPWGIDYINAPDVWDTTKGYVDVNNDGDSEIEVAVIDTGVDTDHPDLASNIKWCIATLDQTLTNNCEDGNGHGTHVIGTIAALLNGEGVVGAAPEVEIYAIKALNDQGSGTYSDIVMAIDQAIKGPDGVVDSDGDGVIVGDPDDDAAEVISMSLGGSSGTTELHEVIQSAYNWGITIVAAAGNEGASSPSYPAAYPEVIAVGAIDSSENVPWWSNRNPEVAAPGVDILSTYKDGGYETLSGTSMATPHVSATVALMQAARLANGLDLLPPGTEDDTSDSTIRGILHTTAKDLGASGYDSLYGYGAIQADAAVNKALGATQPPEQPPEQPTMVELLSNTGFDEGPDGWYFYKGDYIDEAYWYSTKLGRDGVIGIMGDIPSWQWWVDDYAYIGQDISVPSNANGDGTITVEFYPTSSGPDVNLVVIIYDRSSDTTVWSKEVDVTMDQWGRVQITVPSDVIASIRGGDYLFLVGMHTSAFTLWWSDSAAMYFDSVSFQVPTS